MLGCIQPMSSPMMKRMLGFCCCCAAAGMLAAIMAANDANRPSQIYLAILMLVSSVRLPVRADSLCPTALSMPHARRHRNRNRLS